MAVGGGAAQATPSAAFDLRTSRPCVAGTCRALLTYDITGLVTAVRVEVDWDTRDSPGGFQPDDAVDCTPAAPRRPGLRAAPVRGEQPRVPRPGDRAGRHPGHRHGRRHAGDRDAAGRRRGRAGRQDRPGPARLDRRPVRAAPGRRAVRPRQRPQDERRRRQGPAQRLARGDRDPVEGARQRRAQEGRRPRQRRAARPPRLRPPLRRRGQGHPLGRLGSRRTTTPTRRTSSTAAPATTGSTPATGRRSSRPAPARTTSGPTTAAAPSTAALARTPPGSSSTVPGSCATASAILHFCAFGSDGHGGCLKPGEKKPTESAAAGRVGGGARRPLSDRAVKAAISSRTTGSEPAGPATVSVSAPASSRSSRRRNGQQRRSAATKAAARSRVRGPGGSAGRRGAGSRRGPRDGGHLGAPRGHLGLGEAAGDGRCGGHGCSVHLQADLRSRGCEQWTKRRSPSARSPARRG